jgi:L-Lysine epsilon oxidase N-terminal/L-lysine epsilon oxidase C-terminal domain
MSNYTYRIHPAINIARVGNSEEYYIAPETMAGVPVSDGSSALGGLPIKPGTESDTITSSDLRDADGAFKRQAARFKIYQYQAQAKETYPNGTGTEIQIGSVVDGKKVVDIIWTVHLANKKANCYVLENPNLGPNDLIIQGYENNKLPPLRNLPFGPGPNPDPNDPTRRFKLTIDPGPRTIHGNATEAVDFDQATVASFWDSKTGNITELTNYPKSFPGDSFPKLYCPAGPIDTLGELQTDPAGRLLVVGGYGKACTWNPAPYPLDDAVDNDGWFDDTSDGPVSAVLAFDDKSIQQVVGAWVVTTDPSYAPQTLNVVSVWDDIYDTWVRELQLSPEIFDSSKDEFVDSYQPYFEGQVHPIFRAASMQLWNTNLPVGAIAGHKSADKAPVTPPKEGSRFFKIIRNPNKIPVDNSGTTSQMPLSLGDQGREFLYPSITQYFFLQQWNAGLATSNPAPTLGSGEYLDRAVLVNCLGGRFSPGIDLTFIVRQPDLYVPNWQTSGTGPFRIYPKPLDYNAAQAGQPFLSEGYVPIHSGPGCEPGDTSKFMAVPWHTDYNSCGTHHTDPNPNKNTLLYWSWPAQRPYAIYAAKDVSGNTLPKQRYSVRGKGTENPDSKQQGRYQEYIDMVMNWSRIGVVIQGSSIDQADGGPYDASFFLEIKSQLDDSGDPVVPWPNSSPIGN